LRVYRQAHGVKDPPTKEQRRQQIVNETFIRDQWARARNRCEERARTKREERAAAAAERRKNQHK